jgi:predicted PurR-regulated permease PerM
MAELFGSGASVEPSTPDVPAVLGLLREHGAALWRVLAGVAAASASALGGGVVFVVALYALSADPRRVYAWVARCVPLDGEARRRLFGAFRETGRGLLIGAGGTALTQGSVAAGLYAALGVHNPITFGLLTGIAALVPVVGTAVVWAPIAVALALGGHPIRAAILAALGVTVIGTIDNVLRPWLARVAHLRLPVVVVFLSMVGGLRLAGGWGLVLGPLLVRMGVEACELASRRRGPPASGPPADAPQS